LAGAAAGDTTLTQAAMQMVAAPGSEATAVPFMSQQALIKHVNEAKVRVRKVADLKLEKENSKVQKAAGEPIEAFCTITFPLALVDKDNTGILSPSDMAQIQDAVNVVEEKMLKSFETAGIVNALVLAIIFPYAKEGDPDFSWNGTHSMPIWSFAFAVVAEALVATAVAMSLSSLIITTMMYSQLAYMTLNIIGKLSYFNKARWLMQVNEVCKNISCLLMALFLLFSNLSSRAWLGLLGLLPAVAGTAALCKVQLMHSGRHGLQFEVICAAKELVDSWQSPSDAVVSVGSLAGSRPTI